ncbi:MAG: aldo/keto reductase [Rhodospirillales bacterium]|nr:aldo/keto reductase [Rhodospirillales bacterium]
MPVLGLGTWPMKGEACVKAVAGALAMGYRHVDTAEMYENEEAVGAGIRASGVARADIHLTTKVWWEHLEAKALRAAFDASLNRLGTDYVDLFLIHWPAAGMDLAAALDTMMTLRRSGRARAIGVSNFTVALMREAVRHAPIACNQVEYHLMLGQANVLEFARAHGIAVTAYAPVARGLFAEDKSVNAIAQKHGATPEQVALAWLLTQDGVAAIPKAAKPENQRANLAALDLRLAPEDIAALDALPKDRRRVNPSFAPAWDR